ncbi:MAG TPA: T9SS type A sorting domain-containing protein, partial [Rubricoccaceae bacterium]
EPEGGTLALSVGPNPARGAATAYVGTPAGPAVVAVYDALGRRVARVEVEGGASSVAVPLAGLSPGLYVVRLTAGSEARSVRLVVTR